MPMKRTCLLCKKGVTAETTLFSFPTRIDQRDRWAKFCDKSTDIIKKTWKICSHHFQANDFVAIRLGKKLTLKDGAIPTVKNFEELKTPKNCTLKSTNNKREFTHKYSKNLEKSTCKSYCFLCGKVSGRPMRRFPTNSALKQAWAQSLNLTEDQIKHWHRVCSVHFPYPNARVPVLLLPNSSDAIVEGNHFLAVNNEVSIKSKFCVEKSARENESADDSIGNQSSTSSNDPILEVPKNLVTDMPTSAASCQTNETSKQSKIIYLNFPRGGNNSSISTALTNAQTIVQADDVVHSPRKYSRHPNSRRCSNDVPSGNSITAERATLCVRIAKQTIQPYKDKINALEQKYSCAKRKLDAVENTLQELKSKNLLSDQALQALQLLFPSIM